MAVYSGNLDLVIAMLEYPQDLPKADGRKCMKLGASIGREDI